jgi:hypothetical protein
MKALQTFIYCGVAAVIAASLRKSFRRISIHLKRAFGSANPESLPGRLKDAKVRYDLGMTWLLWIPR